MSDNPHYVPRHAAPPVSADPGFPFTEDEEEHDMEEEDRETREAREAVLGRPGNNPEPEPEEAWVWE